MAAQMFHASISPLYALDLVAYKILHGNEQFHASGHASTQIF